MGIRYWEGRGSWAGSMTSLGDQRIRLAIAGFMQGTAKQRGRTCGYCWLRRSTSASLGASGRRADSACSRRVRPSMAAATRSASAVISAVNASFSASFLCKQT